MRTGETVVLVGESGSGKSVTALSLLRLLPTSGRITGGSVQWRARDLAGLKNPALEQIRGGETALVPQDPATALNPVFTVGDQSIETLLVHAVVTPDDVHSRMLDLLDTCTFHTRRSAPVTTRTSCQAACDNGRCSRWASPYSS